jgi:hypothetical protein
MRKKYNKEEKNKRKVKNRKERGVHTKQTNREK